MGTTAISFEAVLLFAHAGIALGAAAVMNGLIGSRLDTRRHNQAESVKPHARHRAVEEWMVSLGQRADLSLLLLGAILSDLTDKPMGRIFYGTFGCRLFCHSLLFLLLVVVAGLLLYYRRHRNWLLVIAFGVLMHLVLDGMWADTKTLFWPALGLSFTTVRYDYWYEEVLHKLTTSPDVYLPELAGLLIIVWLAWLLVRHGKVWDFVKHGRILD
ncbi:MAG: metal-dependent hydrolase [Dehalococcoidia bacterium]|nr:metal-dependent hydrolase [Dehalococcoidia bacterium]